jgi:multicomponent Na+:H+ antiporter subunit D
MRFLLPAPIGIPLLCAALCVVAHRHRNVQRFLALVGVGASLVVAVVILVLVERDGVAATTVGGWQAPVGIALVADLFAGMMLVISLITVFCVLVYAIGQRGADDQPAFHPVYLVLAGGVALSFLAGDLFNLYVAFEITLTASYVLITLGGLRDQVRHGMTYVVVNLVASLLFLTAIGFVYAATGSVNLADLSERLPALPGGLHTAIGLLFLVVFGTKAAVFPVFNWLPDSYPTARAPVTAIFAGLLTKVGVYCLIRSQTLLFPEPGPSTFLLALAALTMIVGVLGAIAQNDMKRILSFHIVSQIGYMILGLGLFTVAGVAGAILFVVHQIPVKTSLFLTAGLVEEGAGSTALDRVGGLLRRAPLTAALFGLAALSLAGIPPFSGFVGKLSLIEAGFSAQQWAIVGVSLVGSLLTLFSMAKIWNGVFWGRAEAPTPQVAAGGARLHGPWLMNGANIVLVGVTIAIAIFAGPIYDLSVRAAEGLLDPSAYVDAVLAR